MTADSKAPGLSDVEAAGWSDGPEVTDADMAMIASTTFEALDVGADSITSEQMRERNQQHAILMKLFCCFMGCDDRELYAKLTDDNLDSFSELADRFVDHSKWLEDASKCFQTGAVRLFTVTTRFVLERDKDRVRDHQPA